YVLTGNLDGHRTACTYALCNLEARSPGPGITCCRSRCRTLQPCGMTHVASDMNGKGAPKSCQTRCARRQGTTAADLRLPSRLPPPNMQAQPEAWPCRYRSRKPRHPVGQLLLAPALHGGRDAHCLAIFRHGTPGDLDTVALQPVDDHIVRQHRLAGL